MIELIASRGEAQLPRFYLSFEGHARPGRGYMRAQRLTSSTHIVGNATPLCCSPDGLARLLSICRLWMTHPAPNTPHDLRLVRPSAHLGHVLLAQARRVAKMLQPPSAAEVRELVASAPVWLASASRIGDTVGVLAHKIWISLVEWCDGRTLHGATLEVSPREIMPVEITRDRSSVNKSLGPYPHAN